MERFYLSIETVEKTLNLSLLKGAGHLFPPLDCPECATGSDLLPPTCPVCGGLGIVVVLDVEAALKAVNSHQIAA